MTSHTTHFARWIAGYALMAGLGTTVITGAAVASADTGPTSGPSMQAGAGGADGAYQSARRRATFSGACVTEVKLDDLDANSNK